MIKSIKKMFNKKTKHIATDTQLVLKEPTSEQLNGFAYAFLEWTNSATRHTQGNLAEFLESKKMSMPEWLVVDLDKIKQNQFIDEAMSLRIIYKAMLHQSPGVTIENERHS